MSEDEDTKRGQLVLIPAPIVQPLISVEHLLRWQSQALSLMTEVPKLEPLVDNDPIAGLLPIPGLAERVTLSKKKIHIVQDGKGKTGKTTFLNAIKHHNPERFLILDSMPENCYRTEEQRLKDKGIRPGGCLIVETKYLWDADALEEIALDWCCSSIWIFATDTSRMRPRLRIGTDVLFYNITADLSNGLMSNLIPMQL